MPMDIAAHIPQLGHELSPADVRGMWRMRWGVGRDDYTFKPGLYRLGAPDSTAPILVTGNYKFTVDVVRRDTAGLDAWLLVIDTRGINVWCAAGKGTFGTDEIVRRVMGSDLPLVAESQTLIVPQLGAPGVAAHDVRKATGYRVVYGPVRASDTKAFIEAGNRATAEMREVTFGFQERLELVPVELVGMFRGWRWLVPVALFLLGTLAAWLPSVFGMISTVGYGAPWGLAAAALYLLGVVSGGLIVPVLLPWLPGRMFAAKGALAGAVVALPVAWLFVGPFTTPSAVAVLVYAGVAAIIALAAEFLVTAVSSFVAMNYTGTSPVTSPTGVERELRRWIPIQSALAALGLIGWLAAPALLGVAQAWTNRG